jgi:hypothetical protein
LESIELLERFGVEVAYIRGMLNEACYVTSQNVGLIRAGLTDVEREAAAALILSAVLLHQGAPLPQ